MPGGLDDTGSCLQDMGWSSNLLLPQVMHTRRPVPDGQDMQSVACMMTEPAVPCLVIPSAAHVDVLHATLKDHH